MKRGECSSGDYVRDKLCAQTAAYRDMFLWGDSPKRAARKWARAYRVALGELEDVVEEDYRRNLE